MLPAGSLAAVLLHFQTTGRQHIVVGALYHKLQTQSSVPEDGRNHRPEHVELIGIINKALLLHLVV
jgi:hypothetical protein